MPTTTTTYSFNKPVVGADEDDWGGYLNGNWDSVDDLLDGTTPVTGIDINSGTIDGVTIGGTTAGAGTFTTLTANTSITGTLATAAQPNITSVGTLTGLTVSASASLAGASTTADITFGDNDKAIFGAGSDLQIYHNGSASFIDDAGSGYLNIRSNGVSINKYTGETMALFVADGAATLYHDNAAKLATTSTGIDVTGRTTTDNATVGSGTTSTYVDLTVNGASTSNYGPMIELQSAGTAFGKISNYGRVQGGTSTDMFVTTATTNNLLLGTNNVERMRIDSSGRVMIGTTTEGAANEAEELTISGTGGVGMTIRSTDSGTSRIYFSDGTTGTPEYAGYQIYNHSSNAMIFGTNAIERMRIDSSGNVGIGTSSPSSTFRASIYGDGSSIIGGVEFRNAASGGSTFTIGHASATSPSATLNVTDAANLIFKTDDTERMRIDSSGNVGIGTSSPNIANFGKALTITDPAASDQIPAIELAYGSNTRGANIAVDNRTSVKALAITAVASDLSMTFGTNNTERMRIDSSGNVGIGNSSPSAKLEVTGAANSKVAEFTSVGGESRGLAISTFANGGFDSTGVEYKTQSGSGAQKFSIGTTEAMRIDSSGNLLVGKSSTTFSTAGARIAPEGSAEFTRDSVVMNLNRLSTDGEILRFFKDGTTVGGIGVAAGNNLYISSSASDHAGLEFSFNSVLPQRGGTSVDNIVDLGISSYRYDDIYATNGTIQTSDQNEKQDIAELSDAEQRVAVAAKGLLRKFRWRGAVEEKGDEARTHFGIIAQDLQAAFTAEGLDAGDYAMFIHTTWTDEETGEERSRMGVRYSELLAFIIAAI